MTWMTTLMTRDGVSIDIFSGFTFETFIGPVFLRIFLNFNSVYKLKIMMMMHGVYY